SDERIELKGDALKFAARYLSGDRIAAGQKLKPGDVVRITPLLLKDGKDGGWQIAQLPEVEAAFLALSPADGKIQALVGGFDFNRNMLNHVTQAWRQPGSAFKPFVFSAALEKGFSPGNIVMDTPVTIPASETGSSAWTPKNYSGNGEGPMSLRTALAKSKNIPAVRLIRAITPAYAQDFSTRFGFDPERQPPYLTMALGAGSVTPWQMASAYAIFANGGYRIQPYVVSEIKNAEGQVLARAEPVVAGENAQQVLDPRNAYLMDSMLRDVAIRGTAARASRLLKRHDLAGKTGTTNDYRDAWFCGFQATAVGCAWLGFDQPKKLGSRETGGVAALPIWIDYMKTALNGVPEAPLNKPQGVVGAYGDLYYTENVPSFNPNEDPTTWLGYEPPEEEILTEDGSAPVGETGDQPHAFDPAQVIAPH
ncbi:MAG: penicillin-binding protein, partial [Zoogloeaceae bacterium]|nr:penicillin-binding protein [Zoogloeaceae bacterium]